MKRLTRRRAIKLASSFLATVPLLGSASRAQPASSTGAIVFDMANFLGAGGDADTAFAKALAAISKAAGDKAAGRFISSSISARTPPGSNSSPSGTPPN